MTGWQRSPGELYIDTAATDGAYVAYKSGRRFTRFLRLIGVTIDTTAGTATVSTVTPDPIVTVVNGVPGLIFDNDGEIVYVEGP